MRKVSLSGLFLFVLLIGMTIIALSLWGSLRNANQENARLRESQVKTANTIVEKYIDRVDTVEHTVFEDKIVTRSELKDGQVPIDQGLLDSMVLALKTADGKEKQFNKRITSLTRAKATLEDIVQGMEADPTKGYLYSFNSKYLTARLDTAYRLNYRYNAEVRVASYEEPTGFLGLGKSKHYVDISSPDPNFKINSVDRFRVETPVKPKPWGIGIIGGWTVDPTLPNGDLTFRPTIGVGVSYNFIRF